MEYIKKKFNNIICKKELVVSLLFSLICYGSYIFPHYSQDVYAKYGGTGIEVGTNLQFVLSSGRFTYAFLNKILTTIFHSNIPLGMGINIFTIVMFAIVSYVGYETILNDTFTIPKENKIVCFLCINLFFFNPLFCDWLQFPECAPIYMIGLLMAVLSAKFLFEEFKYHLVVSLILLILAVGTYQPVIIYFVLFVLIKIWNLGIKNKCSTRKIIGIVLISILEYACASGVQFIIIIIGKVFQNTSSRISNSVLNNLKVVISSQKELWLLENTGSTNYIYIIVTFIAIAYFCYTLINIKYDIKEKIKIGLVGFLLVFVYYFSVFITHIFIESWMSQRTLTGFIAIPSIFVLFSMEMKENDSNKNKRLVGFVLIVLQIFFMYRTNNLSLDLIKVNALDKGLSENIEEYIEEYEENNNEKVLNIAYCNDESVTWTYSDIYSGYDLNVRGWAKGWSIPGMIEFYTGRKLNLIEMPEEVFKDKFKNKNWNYFNENQLFFDKDTVYICVY